MTPIVNLASMSASIPAPVNRILGRLRENGFAAVVAGGAVRDLCLGKVPEDFDILTHAAIPEIEALFADHKVRTVGKTFPVCRVDHIEVAPARSGTGRFPVDDLAMRDFTINAMAWDPVKETLIDPFSGRTDLENRVIRFTRDPDARILEDPVRMVRGCRFAALLDARLCASACKAILHHAGTLVKNIPGERLRNELIKAMALPKPSLFFRHLHDTGLLAGILPSLDRCYGLDGGPFHGETVFDHCLLVGDALPARQPLLRLAGYLHDAGKIDSRGIKEGRVTFHGHETSIGSIRADLDRLRFSTEETTYILALIHCHMRPLAEKTRPKSVRRLLAALAENHLDFHDFMRLRIADKKGNLAKAPYTLADIRDRLQKVRDARSCQSAFQPGDLQITGHDIMATLKIPPGPEVGRIQQQLFEKVLDDPSLNTRDRLLDLMREMV
jgi:tRNA nucleotidyltransferase (CCA-adding enzyme)